MKKLQNYVRLESFKILQQMIFSRSMTETVKRAIRVRLTAILDNEEKTFANWKIVVKHKLNRTRQKQIEREFKKRIQAAKIVVHWLTPFFERTEDVPTFVIRKDKNAPL